MMFTRAVFVLSAAAAAHAATDDCAAARAIADQYVGTCDVYHACMSNTGFVSNAGFSSNSGFANDGFMSNDGFSGNDGFSANDGFVVCSVLCFLNALRPIALFYPLSVVRKSEY